MEERSGFETLQVRWAGGWGVGGHRASCLCRRERERERERNHAGERKERVCVVLSVIHNLPNIYNNVIK